MKKITLVFALLLLINIVPGVAAQTGTPPAAREVNSIWKNKDLFLFGYHKPYVTLKVYNGATLLGQAQSNALGKFELTVSQLDPAQGYQFTVKAYDRFGREIADLTQENSNSVSVKNILTLSILPGTVYQGQILDATREGGLADATIQVYDAASRKLLTQTRSDSQGKFAVTGVPKNSYVMVSKEGYTGSTQNISQTDFQVRLVSGSGQGNQVNNNSSDTPTTSESASADAPSGNFLLIVIITLCVLAGLVLGGLWWYKRKK